MSRSSADIATEIADRLLFAALYPEQMCRVTAATYGYDTQQLVLAYGDALVAERQREQRAQRIAPVLRRALIGGLNATAEDALTAAAMKGGQAA